MGVKKSLQSATGKLASRARQTGLYRRLSSPSSAGSFKARGAEWVYLIILFLLAGGMINAVTNAEQVAGYNIPIIPNFSMQNVTETFIMLFVYIVGSLGAYALYLSGRQTIRARSAEMFFLGGITLISIAIVLGYFILSMK